MTRTAKITPERRALLALIQRHPTITAAVATKEAGRAVGRELQALSKLGLLHATELLQISGNHALAYMLTPAGAAALSPARDAPQQAPTFTRLAARSDTYTCPELGRTCQRPGAYDFLQHPSLIAGQRVLPRGAA